MATFENPNNPRQPQKGIYGWFARKGDSDFTIYIGQAGKRNTCLPTGTLYRGASELQRSVFSSNPKTDNYSTLDTDFIVGTAIRFFEKCGYQCAWKHVDNDPSKEEEFVINQRPILQDIPKTTIKGKFKVKKPVAGYWKTTQDKIDEAQNEVFKELSIETGIRIP
jgi:hypothetical protein